ncbi:MAG: sensor histidine kinase [Caldilineae bacterium]|nr:MAG: sensor histidine kinase [Caldilineae bacterium]
MASATSWRPRRMLHSLRLRLLMAVIAVIAAVMSAVAYYGTRSMSSEFQRYIDSKSVERGRAMSELLIYYRQNRSWENVQPLLEQMGRITGDRIILADQHGRVIADSEGALLDDKGAHIERLLLEGGSRHDLGRPAVLIDSREGPTVYVYITSREGEEPSAADVFLGSVNRQLMIAVVIASCLGLLLLFTASRRIFRPVEALTAAVRRMEQGDLSQRVEVTRKDEIGELGRAFNAMADALARQEALRRNLVSDVAHELRTPVSNIRGYLEALRDGVLRPTPELIGSLHDEIMLLSRLLDDLQDLALAEAGALQMIRRPTMLEEVVRATVHRLAPKARQRGIQIFLGLAYDLPLVDIDEQRIEQVLGNILSNAITYTPPGGTIEIHAEVVDGEVQVAVSDTGEGIAPEHLPYIFDRFYRSDWSRTRKTGGHGLGLAIAKQWVQAHGGRIWADSEPGKGTTITFTLPVSAVQLDEEALAPAGEGMRLKTV